MVKERPVYKPRPRYLKADSGHEPAPFPGEHPHAWDKFVNQISLTKRDWPLGVRALGLFAGAATAIAFAGLAFLYLIIKALEPHIPDSDLYALNRPPAYTVLDAKGDVAGIRGARVGERLKLAEMPPYLPLAFLAMEDRRFYGHNGVDPVGLARAALADYKEGRFVQGGSTITQQLVKVLFLTPDRTVWRKLREVAGAWAIERKLSKNEILELYLNRIYLGAGAYGVDGAAHIYFGKSARKVTLAEAAMLAALTTAPSAFSPRRDLAMAQQRADLVLNALVSTKALTEKDVAYARAHPATVADTSIDVARNYFLDAAIAEARELTNAPEGDLVIATTLDKAMQEQARAAVDDVIESKRAQQLHATQAALVAMAPDGAVRALIGGRDYAQSSFNRATQAHRQPGSAFKPIVYLAALERGLSPSTVRYDEPIAIRNYAPDNYGSSHSGPVTLQEALARSINTVAVRLGQEVGLKTVVDTAHRLGIRSNLSPQPSLPLGTYEVTPIELTGAYASFASGGLRATPYTVREVRAGDGTVLYAHPAGPPLRVIREQQALTMNGMLYQVVQWGTGHAAAVPGYQVAGKTGTSADWRDAWFVGFSSNLVAGVWIGNDDSSPMKKVTGGLLPAQLWSGFMRTALQKNPAPPLGMIAPQPQPQDYFAEDDEGVVARGLDRIGNFFDRLFGGGLSSNERISNYEQLRQTYDGNANAGNNRTASTEPAPPSYDESRTFANVPAPRAPAPEPRRSYADAMPPSYDDNRGFADMPRTPPPQTAQRSYSDTLREWYDKNRAADAARGDDRFATAELNRRQSNPDNMPEPPRDNSYNGGGGASPYEADRPSYRQEPRGGDGRFSYYGDSYMPPAYRAGRYGQ